MATTIVATVLARTILTSIATLIYGFGITMVRRRIRLAWFPSIKAIVVRFLSVQLFGESDLDFHIL